MGYKVTKKQVMEALESTKGSAYLAAKKLNVSHTLIYDYLNEYPEVRAIQALHQGVLIDVGVLKLTEAVYRGEQWAVKYVLSTLGKERGFSERQEISGPEGKDIEIKVEFK